MKSHVIAAGARKVRGQRRGPRTLRNRGGAVLVVVLICLVVAAAVSVIVVRQIAGERRTLDLTQRELQAFWLAEAGIERATARLVADSKYVGETWTLSAADLGADDSATVRIQVDGVPGKAAQRLVRVDADTMDGASLRVHCQRQIVVDRDALSSHQQTKASP